MVYHTATLIVLSLSLLFPSLGAKITTPIIIYISCYFGSSQCKRKRNTLIIYSVIVFFPPTCWGTGGDLALLQGEFASSLTGTLISQSVSKLESYPINRFTSTDGSLSLHSMSVNDLQKVHFVNRLYQRLQVKQATRFSPGSNSSQH